MIKAKTNSTFNPTATLKLNVVANENNTQ